tara:strand:+ start:160 stop:342 length:183 start_codon:yes stop_codon:yes gene_type:complete
LVFNSLKFDPLIHFKKKIRNNNKNNKAVILLLAQIAPDLKEGNKKIKEAKVSKLFLFMFG